LCADECTIVRPEVEGEVTLLYVQLLGAAFYMIIGMAILSMCFSLIQEEMLIKVVLIANLCGCNKKPDEHTAQRIAHEKQQQQVRTYTVCSLTYIIALSQEARTVDFCCTFILIKFIARLAYII
jgi:hypothetical protein